MSYSAPSSRLTSLDVLRGLNVWVMLFVNDLAGVAGVPAWLKHISPPSADGMTLVDVVFPAFLFIAGLSLPLALERRFASGESPAATARHILSRTLVLLLLGVLMVNGESMRSGGPLDPRLWNLLLYAGICLVWTAAAGSPRTRRIIGVLLLAAAVLLYRGQGETGLIEMRPRWWGILGLIGWAYGVTAFLYLFLRRNRTALAGAVVLLYCLYLADGVGFFGNYFGISRFLNVGGALGSHAAVTASGALLGITLIEPEKRRFGRILSALSFAAVLGAAGVILHALHGVHRMFIYNKIAATPPWCLVSSAWTALIWAAVYWLVEVKKLAFGTGLLASAGRNALFAFILGPIAYSLFDLPALLLGSSPYWALGRSFLPGLLRSIVFAFAALGLTAFLQNRKLYLRI